MTEAEVQFQRQYRKAAAMYPTVFFDEDLQFLHALRPAEGGIAGCEAAIGKRYGRKDAGYFDSRGDKYMVALTYFRARVLPNITNLQETA